MPMCQSFVDAFMAGRPALRRRLEELYGTNGDDLDTFSRIDYADLIRATFQTVRENLPAGEPRPNPDRIWELCPPDGWLGRYDGEDFVMDPRDLSGTLLYVVPEEGHEPVNLWYVRVEYGSCSACDTIRSLVECEPRERAIEGLETLCLHVVQQTRPIRSLVPVDREEVDDRFRAWAKANPITFAGFSSKVSGQGD